MNWSDEKYVRLYVRDTPDWKLWPWQARALMPLLMRKVDRAGVLELGRHGVRGLAATVEMPEEVVAPGLDALLEDGCVVRRGEELVIVNFIEAQECGHSDRVRQAESRRRRRDGTVTQAPEKTQVITERHGPSQASQPVTDGHPVLSRAVPSRAESVPSEPAAASAAASQPMLELVDPPDPAKAAKAETERGYREAGDRLRALWRELKGDPRADFSTAGRAEVRRRLKAGRTEADLAESIRWHHAARDEWLRTRPLDECVTEKGLQRAAAARAPPHPSSGAGIEDVWKTPPAGGT